MKLAIFCSFISYVTSRTWDLIDDGQAFFRYFPAGHAIHDIGTKPVEWLNHWKFILEKLEEMSNNN